MTDETIYYAAALILCPDRRTAYIQKNWKPKWRKPILKKVQDLWVEYREASQPLPSNEQVQEEEEEQELDIFDQAKQDLRKGVICPASQDEYEDYISGDLYEYVGLKGQADALSWWCQPQQRSRWPRLSCMAIDILSMPAISTEPEQVFSGRHHTIS